jgi:hypothetical protein
VSGAEAAWTNNGTALGGHLKTGQWWTPQNRPTESDKTRLL